VLGRGSSHHLACRVYPAALTTALTIRRRRSQSAHDLRSVSRGDLLPGGGIGPGWRLVGRCTNFWWQFGAVLGQSGHPGWGPLSVLPSCGRLRLAPVLPRARRPSRAGGPVGAQREQRLPERVQTCSDRPGQGVAHRTCLSAAPAHSGGGSFVGRSATLLQPSLRRHPPGPELGTPREGSAALRTAENAILAGVAWPRPVGRTARGPRS
jgi:hypothetical protein